MRIQLGLAVLIVLIQPVRVEAGSSDFTVRVLVYNYAGVPAKELTGAQKVATKIFREAGIEVAWETCAGPGAEEQACQGPFDSTVLFLRLLPRKMAERVAANSQQFGYAQLAKTGAPGIHAYVFHFRLEELAGRNLIFQSDLLGQVMAHEIGHLLLGTNSHSRRGIMQSFWGGQQLKQANLKNLYFSSKQSARVRAKVARRRASTLSASR